MIRAKEKLSRYARTVNYANLGRAQNENVSP
jgi:hypothetical protein